MAAPSVTPAAVQASLGVSGMNATILESSQVVEAATKANYYVDGRVDAPGRVRWVETTNTDSAATQAAAILASLRVG